MTRREQLDELFGRFLISATEEEIESSRWQVLNRLRSSVHAEQDSTAVSNAIDIALSYGDYLILRVLSEGERHGYGIMTEIATVTEGATTFGPGTFYTSISRLLADGFIEETRMITDFTLNDEPRQYYRLTRKGQRAALVESERLASRSLGMHEQQVMRSI
jgi:DNA-binding PadR family transcriptional regulator